MFRSVFIVSLCFTATAAEKVWTEDAILLDAQLHADFFPKELSEDLSIDNLRKYLKPTVGELWAGQKKVLTLDLSEPKKEVTSGGNSSDDGGIDVDTIVTIGKEIWELVVENTAVVNYTSDFSGAVPEGITDWTKMEGWKDTQVDEISFKFTNGIFTLTEFKWVFAWKYNGQYNNTGAYVTSAGAVVDEVYAYLTEHVNVAARASNPINYGTTESPVGGLDVKVLMESHGYFESTTVGCTLTMRGDGTSDIITCDQN